MHSQYPKTLTYANILFIVAAMIFDKETNVISIVKNPSNCRLCNEPIAEQLPTERAIALFFTIQGCSSKNPVCKKERCKNTTFLQHLARDIARDAVHATEKIPAENMALSCVTYDGTSCAVVLYQNNSNQVYHVEFFPEDNKVFVTALLVNLTDWIMFSPLDKRVAVYQGRAIEGLKTYEGFQFSPEDYKLETLVCYETGEAREIRAITAEGTPLYSVQFLSPTLMHITSLI